MQAPIAARASGYLKRWTKDIGSKVERGELLAEIETPEIDQQLSQAIAARDQAAASLALSKSTVDRWEGLRKKDVVSQQDLEERRSAVAQSQANVAAAEANVQRLRQLEGFKRVVAPFAGVITRRNVDVGDLIDGNGSRPLFLLAQTDPLRVYVNVPQTYAQLVKPGQPVVVTQAELRGQTFQGQVARTAASIDANTRTMQVEIALPNPDGRLLPGAYVQVALPLASSGALTMPTNTLLFRGEGTLVAVVDAQGKVALRKVGVGPQLRRELRGARRRQRVRPRGAQSAGLAGRWPERRGGAERRQAPRRRRAAKTHLARTACELPRLAPRACAAPCAAARAAGRLRGRPRLSQAGGRTCR